MDALMATILPFSSEIFLFLCESMCVFVYDCVSMCFFLLLLLLTLATACVSLRESSSRANG